MHELLLTNQDALEANDIDRHAARIGLDLARFKADLDGPTVLNQVDMKKHASYAYGDAGQYYLEYSKSYSR